MDNKIKFIFGKNPVKERLKIIRNGILYVKKNINDSAIIDILNKAKSKNIKIEYRDSSFFESNFHEKVHQGIALEIEDDYIASITINDIIEKINESKKSIILILDGIEDVGNLGAVLRSALLFNVDAVSSAQA